VHLKDSVKAYAVRHKDLSVLSASQSGGVFTAISDVILRRGGVIYGAAFNSDFSVSHSRAETEEERDRFRGSKYVQSDMGDVFRSIRNDLMDGRQVMFSGTPCQVAGLVSFLPTVLRRNLVTVDIICHGVPSPSVWKDYLSYISRGRSIAKADFRDKSIAGWKVHKESVMLSDGTKVVSETFKTMFYKNIMLRDSCHACRYDIADRLSDITIADFWGLADLLPHLDNDSGMSMVIPHTEMAAVLLDEVKADIVAVDVSLTEDFFRRRNPNALAPAAKHPEREKFEALYQKKGFVQVARRWSDIGWRYKAWKLKMFFKRMLGIV
jgi:coenzyme F420-reducing hydrogenase beta subunit